MDETNLVNRDGTNPSYGTAETRNVETPGDSFGEDLTLDELYAQVGNGPAQLLYGILCVFMAYSEYAELTVFS